MMDNKEKIADREAELVRELRKEQDIMFLEQLGVKQLASMVVLHADACDILGSKVKKLKIKNHNYKVQLKALTRCHVILKHAYKSLASGHEHLCNKVNKHEHLCNKINKLGVF
jgi:hypothetical protein